MHRIYNHLIHLNIVEELWNDWGFDGCMMQPSCAIISFQYSNFLYEGFCLISWPNNLKKCRNAVPFSDGIPGDARGIPYFYLATLDLTARNALKDERSSFTIGEFPLGACGREDHENLTYTKLTLTGKVRIGNLNMSSTDFSGHHHMLNFSGQWTCH